MLYGLVRVYNGNNRTKPPAVVRGVDYKRDFKLLPDRSVYFEQYFISQDANYRAKCIKSIKYVWKHFLEPLSPDSLSDCSVGRFLVYNCRNNDIYTCGGLGDRERGIISSVDRPDVRHRCGQTMPAGAISVTESLQLVPVQDLYTVAACK